ncbi:MAG TPA: YfhO family protein [Thermoanaerobaculia bacterium]|nr:YfhO family protein [Thermoanaerobaculia bacterium]
MNFAWLLVGAYYAAAVALARRARIDLPWRVAGAFYLLVLAFFFKPLTGPYVNVAPDVLHVIAPWSSPGFTKDSVSNYDLQDVVFQFVPWTQQVHESWREGRVPLWNPLTAAGMPLLANMQSGALSPLRLLTIPLPLAHAFSAEAALKILVALTFTFLFCRRRGYDVVPSMIGAIAFGFSTFMTLWLHFPHPNVAAFLPAVLFQIDLLQEQVTRGRFLFAAFLGPVILAGGHPETVAHTVFFAALYALWIRCPIGRLLAVSAVSLFLSAPILLPFLQILADSWAYHDARALEHHAGTAYSDKASLALLVHPRIYGQRPGPLWGPAFTEAATGFAGILGIGAWIAMAVRVIQRRQWRSAEMFFALATLLMLLLIVDAPFVSAPVRWLFSLALNSRFRLQFVFLLAVQTAALVHCKQFRWLAIATSMAVLAFVLADAQKLQFALLTAIPSAIVLALAPFRKLAPLLALALFAELWGAGHSWHPVHKQEALYPRTPLLDTLQSLQTKEPYRIVGLGGMLFPNTHVPFGFEDVRVKDALASHRYLELLRRNVKHFDMRAYYWKWEDADTPLLDRLNVKWVLSERELHDTSRYKLVYEGYDGRIYENLRVMPRFFGAPMQIVSDRELRVRAPQAALIRTSIAYWPGWHITHNGRSLEPQRVDEVFLGFTVPAGAGTVRLTYRPLAFWLGVALAAAAFLATLLLYHPPPCSTRPGSTQAPSTSPPSRSQDAPV